MVCFHISRTCAEIHLRLLLKTPEDLSSEYLDSLYESIIVADLPQELTPMNVELEHRAVNLALQVPASGRH